MRFQIQTCFYPNPKTKNMNQESVSCSMEFPLFFANRLKKFLAILLLVSPSFLFGQNSQYSEEDIPYDVGGMNIPLSYTRYMDVEYGAYSVNNPNYSSTNTQPTFAFSNLAKVIGSSVGTGIDIHLPLIYLLADNDERRFRIAEDIGLGTTIGTNSEKRKDYFTHKKLQDDDILSGVGGSFAVWAGLQAFYRINDTYDIGVKVYPYYLYFNLSPDGGAYGQGYGLHARVKKIYLDFLYITDSRKKAFPATYNVKAKYLYGSKRGFVFVNTMFNHETGPFKITTSAPVTPEISAVKDVPTNWMVFQLGWGILF
jgi:hypothetical protein